MLVWRRLGAFGPSSALGEIPLSTPLNLSTQTSHSPTTNIPLALVTSWQMLGAVDDCDKQSECTWNMSHEHLGCGIH